MKIFSVILLVCAICFPLSAEADTLTLTGVNGNVDATGSVYIDPYYGILNSTPMNINCVDPNHDSYLNTSWSVNVTPLTSGALGSTYLGITLGNTNALAAYEQAAYLLFIYTDNGKTYANMPTSEQQLIQAAVWYIVSPKNNGNGYGADNYYVTNVAPNYSLPGNNYSNVSILTPTNTTNQEFMINSPVPEPSTMLLLGSGLVSLWAVRRRVRKG